MLTLLVASLLVAGPDSMPARVTPFTAPMAGAVATHAVFMVDDTVPRRRHALVYSDWYGRRLTVHRYGSYVMLPLFVAQYALGNTMLSQKQELYAGTRLVPIDHEVLTAHRFVAGTVGALFVVNTTTGLWNLYASRKDPAHRTRRITHALTMLTADAGFVATGVVSRNALRHGPPEARTHRNIGLGAMGVAAFGASLMWFSDHH